MIIGTIDLLVAGTDMSTTLIVNVSDIVSPHYAFAGVHVTVAFVAPQGAPEIDPSSFRTTMDVNAAQPVNALVMEVTVLGIVISVNAPQPENALFPIVTSPSFRFTVVNNGQLENATLDRLVHVDGSVTVEI